MSKEHIVHFKIIRKGETKLLRGLIYLDDNASPTIQDYERCLIACGHQVQIKDPDQYIFTAFDQGEEYIIDVLENYGTNGRDLHAENLAKSFMKKGPFL